MYYGSSYYFEYLPFDRLDDDIRMMKEANLNYARVGDSIWALCEPEEGRFELDWLQRILDALHSGGIAVVLATPTYAIPPWLAQTYPEVMAVPAGGRVLRFGGRQNVDFSHPTFRFYAERMVRAFMERYADHASVVGVQVDNEIGVLNLHNDHVFAAFVAELRREWRTVDALNDAWGLNYWSHRITDWSQLWHPGTMESGNTNPSYDLAWRRFQSRLSTDYLAWQAAVVREYLRPEQFVTHDSSAATAVPSPAGARSTGWSTCPRRMCRTTPRTGCSTPRRRSRPRTTTRPGRTAPSRSSCAATWPAANSTATSSSPR